MAFPSRFAALLALIGALLLLAAPAAQAQEDTSDQPSLPDIAPREIEIRGTLEIALPSLQRQPLSGFNPPPRIPDIPPNRTPHVGTYQPDRDDLPRPVPEPSRLQAELDQSAPPLNGELEAGGGRYFSRFARGKLWLPLSPNESLTLSGDYEGSTGFAPFDTRPEVESPYDTFTGQLGVQSRRGRVAVNAEVDGFFDTYTLYGTQVNPQHPLQPSIVPQPDRVASHLRATAEMQTHGDVALGLHGRASGTNYETTVFTGMPDNDSLMAERRLRLGGNLRVPVGTAHGRVDATFTTAGIGADNQFTNDVVTLDGGLTAQLVTRPGLRVHAGGRFLTASIGPEANPPASTRQSARFFVPAFELNWTASSTTTLFLKNRPGVTPHPLADLAQENPYVFDDGAVQPTLRTTDLEAGLQFFAGPFQLAARGGYRYAVNHQYFVLSTDATSAPGRALYAAGTFASRYASARIIHAEADVSLQQMGGVEIAIGGAYRNGRLVEQDATIPYFAPVTAHAVASYTFADQRALIQLTGRVEGARYIDLSESTQIDPYVDFDLETSFDVTPSLGLIFELKNITGNSLERWAQYPQPPLVFTSGLRVQW